MLPERKLWVDRHPLFLFLMLSTVIMAATTILTLEQAFLFQRFFSSYNPLMVVGLTTVVGLFCLYFLNSGEWYSVHKIARAREGILFSSVVATCLVLPTILVDIAQPFPRDMNVLLPASLLFYPTMGFVVEVIFHLLPLTILLVGPGIILSGRHKPKLLWGATIIVAFVEPAFQVAFAYVGQTLDWKAFYLSVHLFIFGLVQLYVFRRYGFLQMYGFRLIYYLHWHVIWGSLRLPLLFS